MARERITEYSAKRIILGEAYRGVALSGSADPKLASIAKGSYVVKVDQGVKKRFLQGLLKTDVSAEEAQVAMRRWETKGYTNFLLEPMVPHEAKDERYISFERVREGVRIIFVHEGGVEVESASSSSIDTFTITDRIAPDALVTKGISKSFIERILSLIYDEYVSFVEINPLLVAPEGPLLLDAAVQVDGAGIFFAHAWNESDFIRPLQTYPEAAAVAQMQRSTAASLKLSIINPHGALFFLLSGGGGSIVALDAVHERGLGSLIGNYGEYSGGPTREETYLYSKAVLARMLQSTAPKKALVIAGGVANFTDVLSTFQGIMDALKECAKEMRDANIRVFVRRGGPNEAAGLEAMSAFLTSEGLLGSVYGSDVPITRAVDEATIFITKKL